MAQQQNGLAVFNNTLRNPRTQEYLASVLGKNKESFITSLTSLVANARELQKCEPLSLMYVGIKAASLNLPLDPNFGYAYAIPYKRKIKKIIKDAEGREREVEEEIHEAQFQMGYKGFIQLALRSGQYQSINMIEVREGEFKSQNLLTGEIEIAAVPDRKQKPIIGYAAFFRLTNGFTKALYWTREEAEAHARKYSQTYSSKYESVRKSSKWTTDFDMMACKTVVKTLISKFGPISLDMQEALKADQAIITTEGTLIYSDNPNNDDTEPEEATFEEVHDEVEAKKEEMREQKKEKANEPPKLL